MSGEEKPQYDIEPEPEPAGSDPTASPAPQPGKTPDPIDLEAL